MNRNYFLILIGLAIACIFLIIITMFRDSRTPAEKEPFAAHPVSPYPTYISALGIVESSSGNISVGTPVNRIVNKIEVTEGSKIKKGDILIRLEDRDLEAELLRQQAAAASELANLHKLESLPRPEDLLVAQAATKIAEVELAQVKRQYEMVEGLSNSRALSQEEIHRRQSAYQQAEAKLQQANADLEKIKAGTWTPDLEIARLAVVQAKANVDRVQADIDRTIIRSPIDGTVLQINVHESESTSNDTLHMPIMIIGNTEIMYLRVGINQFDVPYFKPTNKAVAFLQGDARLEFPLEFVRLEPYLINKQSLTNNILETVDTKVLQILYRIKKESPNLYVGQQMDVFIETDFVK